MSLTCSDNSSLEVYATIEAPLFPTENLEKLISAMSNILPTEFSKDERTTGTFIVGMAEGLESLTTFKELVKKFQIGPMIRNRLLHSILDNMTTLYMNKQAAFAGKIALLDVNEEPPLGVISFSIISNNLERVIDWIFSRENK